MEELTLHYYIRLFSIYFIIFILIIILYFFYVVNKKNFSLQQPFIIQKNETIDDVINNKITNLFFLDIYFLKLFYISNNIFYNKFIHYGEFKLDNPSHFNEIFEIISKPTNIINKITIVEGWSYSELKRELFKYFKNIKNIPYDKVIADTYFFEKNKKIEIFVDDLNIIKKKYFMNIRNNKLLNDYSEYEIMIIGSLIEKEGLDYDDKKKIASVIFNRLEKNMKLQIDATVLYSLTNGKYDLERKLLLKDLKLDHPYNTYLINGLPPKPISYVGKKTLDLIFENHKTDFLFYFFNNSLKRHIFSKSFEEHKIKLNEYRNN